MRCCRVIGVIRDIGLFDTLKLNGLYQGSLRDSDSSHANLAAKIKLRLEHKKRCEISHLFYSKILVCICALNLRPQEGHSQFKPLFAMLV